MAACSDVRVDFVVFFFVVVFLLDELELLEGADCTPRKRRARRSLDIVQLRNDRLGLRRLSAPPRSSRICDPITHEGTNLAVSADDDLPKEERVSPCKRLGADDDFADAHIQIVKRRHAVQRKLNRAVILRSVSHYFLTRPHRKANGIFFVVRINTSRW